MIKHAIKNCNENQEDCVQSLQSPWFVVESR